MIDSHCHLADPKFSSDLEEVIARANAQGIDRMVTIADSLDEGGLCLDIAEKYDQVFCTIGVHPHNASGWVAGGRGSGERLKKLLNNPKVVAVGEIGLDYHYMNSPKEDQIIAFRDQIEIAKELGLPIVVHNRESIEDMMSIIRELRPAKLVLHCNTERWEECAELIEMGYLFSFTGIATYPKSEDIRRTIKHCPLNQMMIETDAPYLSPQSKRGMRNEPAHVLEVAECIAEVKGITLSEVDSATAKNTEVFYGL
jgi:TatD DNase family protein